MECPKCCSTIDCKSEVYVLCDGGCFKSFHRTCIDIPESVVNCLSKNVKWLCDDCLAWFYEQISRNFRAESEPTLGTDLAVIKKQIASITEVLSTILPQRSTQDETLSSIQCAPSHSTPISSSQLNKGSRVVETNDCNCSPTDAASDTVGGNKEIFSLFLTNIDASVTEQEISCMVGQSLGVVEVETIGVIKLVPKWKPHESLRYASFKVLLDGKLKRLALQCNTWPDGVFFREFVEHPRRTWKPARRERSMDT